ncbi:Crp/Fnr family transcriptional regulator [Aquimarina litoralis]|uniref:Crp/Fnr family transcriptional regulator n=1 Tax=Aquimarina litoralis TaxID=584605 RepID=UPI001C57AB4F|nr:Crp/Fnr family transcriptional regulator [Aquimarina litoralis]MBW1294765.1 cyclic nucleotide-binding domain-containing protein [Aquimarina litoralis]
MDALRKYIDRYVALEDAEFDFFYSFLEEKTFQKHEYIQQSGSICTHHHFIIEGLVKSFYIDDSGTERIVQFGIENWWVTNLESFKKQEPSLIQIQTLEKTTVLRIKKQDLDLAFNKIPKIERLFRLIYENWLIAEQRKGFFYMKTSSKDRYLALVESIPNFVQRVPQYMIASYLDITPEYLSELRKSL